jgi:hypothetical protein
MILYWLLILGLVAMAYGTFKNTLEDGSLHITTVYLAMALIMSLFLRNYNPNFSLFPFVFSTMIAILPFTKLNRKERLYF